jgi:hypothetical protein
MPSGLLSRRGSGRRARVYGTYRFSTETSRGDPARTCRVRLVFTDRIDAREIVDAGDLGPEHAGTFLEQWRPLDREALTALLELMAHRQSRFGARREEPLHHVLLVCI